MTGKWFGMALAGVVLAGCAGPANMSMSCSQSCNRDYDVCSDSTGASRDGSSFFGVGAACQRQLSACLKSCELAAVQAQPSAKDGAKSAPGQTSRPPEKP